MNLPSPGTARHPLPSDGRGQGESASTGPSPQLAPNFLGFFLSIGVALLLPIMLEAADPMLTLVELEQLQQITNRHAGEMALVFTEAREFPARRGQGFSTRWLPETQAGRATFSGQARPGEFYVFQVGVYALKDGGPLGMTFSELTGGHETIPASLWRCLSLGGIDHLGRPFTKSITLKQGQLQPLWVGLAVPTNALGAFTGTVQVRVAPDKTIPVGITLSVEGPPAAEGGDSVARNLTRLRWLDSTVGSEATLTQPFPAVQTDSRVIKVLGRELVLSEDGLPARVISHFSPANTRIGETARQVLARPAAFVVESGAGRVRWQSTFGQLTHSDLEATWSARSTGNGLRTETSGRLDFTGSGEVRVRLVAERDIELKDARLEVPFREEVARYFMGLNTQGGRRPPEVHWKWDVKKRQDCFWLGDVNAGLMLRFKDADYLRPPVNIYYAFRPLRLPASWGNEGRGGVDLAPAQDQCVLARAYSGPRSLKKGDVLDFIFELYLTPFRPLDTEKQWAVRFAHLGGPDRRPIDDAVAKADPRRGPNVVNVHHASFYAPYINYPYSDDSFPAFCELVKRAHAKDLKLRVYYTTREITQNRPELFPLHAFSGEVILPGPGREARTLLHPKGPHPWLTEHLREQFVPAWEARVGAPYAGLDLSVITAPDSRWNNFYLEGLRWLVEKSDFDGIYVDDTALDATSLRRARRILDTRPGRLIDLHTWNHFNGWAGFANNLTIYMEILPYLDRLWLGEGFDASAVSPEFWLVEMSGLPFGLMSEMLDGANPWRGLIFGETARYPYSGDPRGLWKVWDEFGIQGTSFLPFFLESCPVKTDHSNVLATVYSKQGRSFIALASWAKDDTRVKLTIDWKALGLEAGRARLYAPSIAGMQTEQAWQPGEPILVAPKRGWFLVLDEVPRTIPRPAAAPAVDRAAAAPIKAFCIDFNWGEGGPNGFSRPGLWADASPAAHVAWYAALGCSVIQTFAVSCNGYAWYKGGLVPPQPGLKYDFLADTVKLGHQQRLKVMGYFCVGANTLWGQTHPQLSYGAPSAPHLPFSTEYLDYLCASIDDALRRTGMDGFMIDWVWNPGDLDGSRLRWLDCERQMYRELFEETFPGKDKITPERELEFRRRAIERCWVRLRTAAKRAKPDGVIWLSCCNVSAPTVINSKLFKEVDWLMNEATDPRSLEQVEGMKGPHTRLVQCVVGWGDAHDARRILSGAAGRRLGIYGFAKPGPDSLPLPVAAYRSRSIASFQGNDRNIAVLARAFTGAPLDIVVAQDADGAVKLLPGAATLHGPSPVVAENQIGHWADPSDSVSWLVDVRRPGRFEVRIEYACDKNKGGSTFIVKVAGRQFELVSEDTGSWRGYRTILVGSVEFALAGHQTVTVTPSPKTPWKAISLKSVTLTPIP
jgi:hypothetical protein